jgi:hypothetical protein
MSGAVVPTFGLARAGRLLVGVLVFQGAWFACVLGAAQGRAGWGVVAVGVAVAVLLAASERRGADLRLIAVALVTGVVWDSVLASTGVVEYASPGPWVGAAPTWILALWALWGAVLREPLRWLHGRPVAGALLGGVGGALSYAAAERLGACRFPEPALAWAVLAAGWALITPWQLALARRLDRETAR